MLLDIVGVSPRWEMTAKSTETTAAATGQSNQSPKNERAIDEAESRSVGVYLPASGRKPLGRPRPVAAPDRRDVPRIQYMRGAKRSTRKGRGWLTVVSTWPRIEVLDGPDENRRVRPRLRHHAPQSQPVQIGVLRPTPGACPPIEGTTTPSGLERPSTPLSRNSSILFGPTRPCASGAGYPLSLAAQHPCGTTGGSGFERPTARPKVKT